jgi:hypothetical protein
MTPGLLPRAFALALGCILLMGVAKGLRTGSTELVDRGVRRQAEPILYWTVILISIAAGVLLVLTAVFAPARRPPRNPPAPVVRELASLPRSQSV